LYSLTALKGKLLSPQNIDDLDKVDLCVVGGAGHVGLPLAIAFAHTGMRTLVYDINEAALEQIAGGELPALEYDADPLLKETLANGNLVMSANQKDVGKADIIIVTIGTPVDEYMNPVHRAVKQCIDDLLPYFRDDQLLVLRSTLYPGTSDWVKSYLVSKGCKMDVAFCPERVVQGYTIRELHGMPQIVGGTDEASAERAKELFARVAPEIVEMKPMEAEFAKLFNNAYRYVQFAITNQFYMIADSAGVDYYRILEGMTHNYPRASDVPGAGFAAGPCLLKDTMQLAAFANNQFHLGHSAMLVNEGLVLHVVDRLRAEYDLANTSVGLVGMAFKAEVDDVRSSLSYKMKKALIVHAKETLTTDPFVKNDPDLIPLDDVISKSDVLVLCTPHKAYKDLDLKGKPVIDVWNFFNN
jgi:UDP-N-acetyl-D-mannosaminuronic acid dehydrogenase